MLVVVHEQRQKLIIPDFLSSLAIGFPPVSSSPKEEERFDLLL